MATSAKVEHGIVVVTAYGFIEGITLPLMFEVYKPKERLKDGDIYRSKPDIAAQMIRELKAMGFRFKLVLADSLYGESGSNFVNVLYELKLDFALAIRSNHAVWLPKEQQVRCNKWREFERVFSDGTTQKRYIREIIFGFEGKAGKIVQPSINNATDFKITRDDNKAGLSFYRQMHQRRLTQFWQITTDKETIPKNSTWEVMTHIPNLKYHQVGNLYGLRNWVEYGLKQSKNELGWADFRVTDYEKIEKWWEIVMSVYLMVSLHAQVFNNPDDKEFYQSTDPIVKKFREHEWWDKRQGWKNLQGQSTFSHSTFDLLQFN